MQQDVMRPLLELENSVITIQMAPGTTIYINVSPEEYPRGSVSDSGAWCIYTLIIHNNEHYGNIIHNFTIHPDLMRSLGLAQQLDLPTASAFMLCLLRQVVLMGPSDVPRNEPLQLTTIGTVSHWALASALAQLHPACLLRRFVQYYFSYVMHSGRIMDNALGESMPPQARHLIALVHDVLATGNSVEPRLERVRRSVRAAELMFLTVQELTEADSDDSDEDSDEDSEEDTGDDTDDETDNQTEDTEEELTSEMDDDSQFDETETCAPGSGRQYDADLASSEMETAQSILLGPHFEDDWLESSSEDEDEEDQEDDEDSYDSDDEESFESYVVRQVRTHGRMPRFNPAWTHPGNETARAEDDESDLDSCGMDGDMEDMNSEENCDTEDLDAWQFNEDRSFETELSRPFRRLVGDLPAQTAQEERLAWREPVVDHGRATPPPVTSNRQNPQPQPQPRMPVRELHNNLHRRAQRRYPTSSTMEAESLSRYRRTNAFALASYVRNRNNMASMSPHPDQGDHHTNNQNRVRESTPEPDSSCTDFDEMEPAQHIVPLQMFVEQTDELIAQLRSSLSLETEPKTGN